MGIKNISPILEDVKSPKSHSRPSQLSIAAAKFRRHFSRIPVKIVFRSIFIIMIFMGVWYAHGLIGLKNDASHALALISNERRSLENAVSRFSTSDAVNSLKNIHQEIQGLYQSANRRGIFLLGKFANPLLHGIGPLVQNADYATILTQTTLKLSQDMDYLKRDGIQAMMSKQGKTVVDALRRINTNLTILVNIAAQIKNLEISSADAPHQLATALNAFEKNYVPLSINLYRAQEFLTSLTSFLSQPNDQHILLIFQNPTEMRPSGGFIGSFGDITLNQGSIIDIRIDDIYNADRQLRHLFIPPKELQGITRNWGARDANWFFDFPTSAQSVIALMEDSELHYQRLIGFQGAIAINTNVLETLIKVIGPISLPEYNLILDETNFLAEIQYEVEAGKDKKPGQNPKRILSVLAPIILERVQTLDDHQQAELFAAMQKHLAQKDVMMYMKDKKIQRFLEDAGVAGSVLQLPSDFNGDYLAIVNANVAGGKSDAFIEEKISLASSINEQGIVTNRLAVTRSHEGQDQNEWWYRATNKNYLKIFTPPKSKLLSVSGNNPYRLSFNEYPGPKYIYHDILKTIEASASFSEKFQTKTGNESGKTFFGMWLHTPLGAEREIKTTYELANPIFLKDGQSYTFAFDKQSGSKSSLDYTLHAPPGYTWAKTNSRIFTYTSDKLPSRLTLSLTLKKDRE